MADRTFHIGGVGPFEIDDTAPYVGAGTLYDITDDAPQDETTLRALRTDGQVSIESAPTAAGEVVRLADLEGAIKAVAVADIDNPAAELAELAGTAAGGLLVVYQADLAQDLFTLYAWDSAVSTGAAVPYVVAGDGGYWVAIAGRYTLGDVVAHGDIILNEGNKLIFNGVGGNVYLVYEGGRLNMYRGGELVSSW